MENRKRDSDEKRRSDENKNSADSKSGTTQKLMSTLDKVLIKPFQRPSDLPGDEVNKNQLRGSVIFFGLTTSTTQKKLIDEISILIGKRLEKNKNQVALAPNKIPDSIVTFEYERGDVSIKVTPQHQAKETTYTYWLKPDEKNFLYQEMLKILNHMFSSGNDKVTKVNFDKNKKSWELTYSNNIVRNVSENEMKQTLSKYEFGIPSVIRGISKQDFNKMDEPVSLDDAKNTLEYVDKPILCPSPNEPFTYILYRKANSERPEHTLEGLKPSGEGGRTHQNINVSAPQVKAHVIDLKKFPDAPNMEEILKQIETQEFLKFLSDVKTELTKSEKFGEPSKISREEAEEKLKDKPVNTCILREYTNKNDKYRDKILVLTVKDPVIDEKSGKFVKDKDGNLETKINHYRIENSKNFELAKDPNLNLLKEELTQQNVKRY